MTVQMFLDFLISYLNQISPLFGSPIFVVPVYIVLTVAAVSFIKSFISGGVSDVYFDK